MYGKINQKPFEALPPHGNATLSWILAANSQLQVAFAMGGESQMASG